MGFKHAAEGSRLQEQQAFRKPQERKQIRYRAGKEESKRAAGTARDNQPAGGTAEPANHRERCRASQSRATLRPPGASGLSRLDRLVLHIGRAPQSFWSGPDSGAVGSRDPGTPSHLLADRKYRDFRQREALKRRRATASRQRARHFRSRTTAGFERLLEATGIPPSAWPLAASSRCPER